MEEEDKKEEPEIHVDEGWKKSVAEEKERLRQEEKERPGKERTEARQSFPEPSIPIFMAGLYTQTLVALGGIESPATGHKQQNLAEAEYLIDTIGLLQKKMQGNLEAEESAYVQNVLTDLRMRYVSATGARDAEAPVKPV